MSQDKSQAPVTSKLSWRAGTEGAWAQGYGRGLGAGIHLGHVFSNDVQPALLLYDHAQKLYQVAMPELPTAGQGGQSLPSLPITSRLQGDLPTHPCPSSRHDGGFSQEGLCSGIVLNALHSNLVPSVVTQHHVCEDSWGLFPGLPAVTSPSQGSHPLWLMRLSPDRCVGLGTAFWPLSLWGSRSRRKKLWPSVQCTF